MTEYLYPFFKNAGVLYLTVFLVYLFASVIKTGAEAFSVTYWLASNKNRFLTAAVVVLGLSTLMAITDASPLFNWLGIDVNASPVGLGLALCTLLGFIKTGGKSGKDSETEETAKQIGKKAEEIKQAAAELPKDSEGV